MALRFFSPISLAVLTVLAAACDRPSQPLPGLLPHVEPFAKLSGVRLGMQAEKLAAQRPRARPEPYMGYSEQVGAYDVGYKVRGSEMSEDDPAPGHQKIEGVRAVRVFPTDSAAKRAYAEVVMQASQSLSARPTCRENSTGRFAIWRLPDGDFTVVMMNSQTSYAVRGDDQMPTRLVSPSRILLEVVRESSFRSEVDRSGGPNEWLAEPCPDRLPSGWT